MSAEHKRLLRRAAQILDAGECDLRYGFGLFAAMFTASNGGLTFIECGRFIIRLYSPDALFSDWEHWRGPLTPDDKQHRIMALLFAAECFDDMEGVR